MKFRIIFLLSLMSLNNLIAIDIKEKIQKIKEKFEQIEEKIEGKVEEKIDETIEGTKTLFDEEYAIPSGGRSVKTFEISSKTKINLKILCVRDCDKGFTILLMPENEIKAYSSKQKVNYVPKFSAQRVKNMDSTDFIDKGSYALVMVNSENIFNRMTIHAKLTTNPQEDKEDKSEKTNVVD